MQIHKEGEMALANKILEIKNGSFLYGLNTPTSDLDYCGVFIPSPEYTLGFNVCDEVDLSLKSKLENGKNSSDAIDRKFYNIVKFVKLGMDNNPNILEMFFAQEEHIVYVNDLGRELLKLREILPTKKLVDRFVGYAISQKKKMIIKKETYFEMEKAVDFLEKCEEGLLLPFLEEYDEFKKYFKYTNKTDEHYRIGDMSIVKNQTAKRAKFEIEKRIGEKTNRKELIKTAGYDYKFGSHLIRLLLEGKELLETCKLSFPLKDKDKIMEIKLGKVKLEDVLLYSEQLEEELKTLIDKTFLPSKPNISAIEKYLMTTLLDFYGCKR